MTIKHPRMAREAKTMQAMIRLYCHAEGHTQQESTASGLCPSCARLMDYANARLERCPFQEGKTTCARCPVHCYKPDMRAQIRQVMKTAGPRMLYRHPLMTVMHMIDGLRKTPTRKITRKK